MLLINQLSIKRLSVYLLVTGGHWQRNTEYNSTKSFTHKLNCHH